MHIETIWNNIKLNEGEIFYKKRGGEYTYTVYNDFIMVDGIKGSRITKNTFAKAIKIENPTPQKISLEGCRGPSYIYGIITDKRIKDVI